MPPSSRVPVRRGGRGASVGLLALIGVAFVLFLLPVLMIVIGAFRDAAPGSAGEWTTRAVSEVLSSSQTYEALGNSLLLMIASVPLGVGLAVVLCWLAARSDSPLRVLLTPTMIVIFAVPQLFYALSWTMLGQAPAGSLNLLVRLVTGGDGSPINLVSWIGLVLVMALKISAVAYLLLLGPFSAINSSLEEAARVSGSSRLGAFFRVEVPAIAPALLSAVVLGGVIAVGSLDIPLVFGRTAGIAVLSTEIYDFINTRVPADYGAANSIALLVIAIVAILVVGQRSILTGRNFTTLSGKSHRRERVKLGRFRVIGGAVIGVYILIALVLPVGQLILGSLQPYAGVYSSLTLSNYSSVLDTPRIVDAFVATGWVGLTSGFLASSLAVLICVVAQRSRSRLAGIPQAMTYALLAVPGITIGLGILAVVLGVPGLQVLYGTQWLNIAGLTIAMTPIATRIISGAVAQVGVELEEAARVGGASLARAVIGILVRLILPSFLAAWFVAAIIAAGNLDIPALLSSPGSETITVTALQLFQQGSLAEASAVFCLFLFVIALLTAVALGLSTLLARRSRTAALRPPPSPPAPAPVSTTRVAATTSAAR